MGHPDLLDETSEIHRSEWLDGSSGTFLPGEADDFQDESREPAERLDATHLYIDHDIRRGKLLTAAEEVELSKRIEAGLLAAKVLENVVLLQRIVEDNFEDWEMAGAMPGEIPEEERAKFRADLRNDLPTIADEGDAAKKLFVESNVRLVINCAKRHGKPGLPFIDHIQNGNTGLIRAVEKFDYTKGYKFSTYAMWWIRQAMDRGYSEQKRMVYLPAWQTERINSINKVKRELTEDLGREPSLAEVAEKANMSEDAVWDLQLLDRQPIYLDAPIEEGETMRVGDRIPYVEPGYAKAEDSTLHDAIEVVLKTLDERRATILRLRYGLDGSTHTYLQIGAIYRLSAERIRQLERSALNQLRACGKQLIEMAN